MADTDWPLVAAQRGVDLEAAKHKMDGIQYALETLLAAMDEGMPADDLRKSLKCIIDDTQADT